MQGLVGGYEFGNEVRLERGVRGAGEEAGPPPSMNLSSVHEKSPRSETRPVVIGAVCVILAALMLVIGVSSSWPNRALVDIGVVACACPLMFWFLRRSPGHRRPYFGLSLLGYAVIGVVMRAVSPEFEMSLLPTGVYIGIGTYHAAGAILAEGILLAMAAYWAVARALPTSKGPPRVGPRRMPSRRMLLAVAWALTGLRVTLQLGFGVGVVGDAPSVPYLGALYHLVHGGLLTSIAAVAIATRRAGYRPAWVQPALLTTAYSVMGALGGRRGAAAVALVVLLVALRPGSSSTRRRSVAVLVIVTGGVALVGFAFAEQRRTGLGEDRSAVVAAYARLGGIPFLAPVLAADTRVPLAELASAYEEKVNVEVYRLPHHAQTAFGVTVWGFGYLTGGLVGVYVMGLAVGAAGAILDRMASRQGSVGREAALVVSVLVWYATMQDGNVPSRIKEWLAVAIVASTISVLAALSGRQRSRGSVLDRQVGGEKLGDLSFR